MAYAVDSVVYKTASHQPKTRITQTISILTQIYFVLYHYYFSEIMKIDRN